MEFATLAYELFLFGIGLYIYLFSLGKMSSKDPAVQKKSDAFRTKNKGWMRILGLALMAIMTVNIVLHIMQWGK